MKYTSLKGQCRVLALDSQQSSFAMDPHVHNEFVIALYLQGRKQFTVSGRQTVAEAGDLLVISPGTPHSASSDPVQGCHYLAMYPSYDQIQALTGIAEASLHKEFTGAVLLKAQPELCQSFLNLFEEEGGMADPAIESFLLELITSLYKPEEGKKNNQTSSLTKIRELICEDPKQELSLSALAEMAGMSKEHLCRTFSQVFGISPFQLLRASRVSYAHKLILQGKDLSAAAFESGFADQSHMTKWFKRIYGTTPSMLQSAQ